MLLPLYSTLPYSSLLYFTVLLHTGLSKGLLMCIYVFQVFFSFSGEMCVTVLPCSIKRREARKVLPFIMVVLVSVGGWCLVFGPETR